MYGCLLRERFVEHLDGLLRGWQDIARRAGIRSGSAAYRLLESSPLQPIVTATSVAKQLSCDDTTAQRAVNRLTDIGILVQRSAGRRNRVFESPSMMDAFAEVTRDTPVDMMNLAAPKQASADSGI